MVMGLEIFKNSQVVFSMFLGLAQENVFYVFRSRGARLSKVKNIKKKQKLKTYKTNKRTTNQKHSPGISAQTAKVKKHIENVLKT